MRGSIASPRRSISLFAAVRQHADPAPPQRLPHPPEMLLVELDILEPREHPAQHRWIVRDIDPLHAFAGESQVNLEPILPREAHPPFRLLAADLQIRRGD